MLGVLKKLFGGKHERDVKALEPLVGQINVFYEEYQQFSDDQLRAKTGEFRARIHEAIKDVEAEIEAAKQQLIGLEGAEREAVATKLDELEKERDEITRDTLDEMLPEAFAAVKDACRRLVGQKFDIMGNTIVWDMIPFDVQLIGGAVLHQGKIAEMATGEGKTLVATMPVYLNALPGRGVHIVTVNDYLAKRDSLWMGKVYEFLGLTVGCIQNTMDSFQRRKEYGCDITYGTNNEFGFDYLRDNMVVDKVDLVHREYYYAIVDEVDSVLIDEARTPLIISGPTSQEDHKFDEMKPRVERLVNAQHSYVSKIVGEAEKLLEAGKEDEAGVLLLRSNRGLPKHPRLMKVLTEPAHKRLVQTTEVEYLRDQSARMHEIDDELYYAIDEKNHQITLTDKGRELLAPMVTDKDFFVLPDLGTEFSILENDDSLTPEQRQQKKDELNRLYAERSDRIHTVTQLLRAYSLYARDDEYVVTDDGKVQIVDEFTGRLLPGRRYSDGLHQAIEAKEGVKVERDMQTLATITLQNYFRLYKKLAGMTGTAETEAGEFFDIYKLDVVVVPTNKPMVREDMNDLVYKTKREKYNAVLENIEEMRSKQRPVLVGTTSVEVSETISRMLKRKGVPHNVLNAKQHQREAEIVSHAGNPGAITIATNMAGRGTDIKLGPGVREAGGLHIVGTERHEARRIDRQLRGRAGRQGDPGSSLFFLSLEDDLMRLFGSERIARIMQRMGLEEGEVITHPLITKSVERAQKKVEENNFGIRKRLLEYDNVMNQQREVVYTRRRRALVSDRIKDDILDLLDEQAQKLVDAYYEEGEIEGLVNDLRSQLLVDFSITPQRFQDIGKDGVKNEIINAAREFYKRKEEKLGIEMMTQIEKMVVLRVIDEKWKDHLREMDDLKEGIHLRAYGQKDPIVEYKTEAFRMFMAFLDQVNTEIVTTAFKLFPVEQQQLPLRGPRRPQQMRTSHESSTGMGFQGNREPVPGGSAQAPPEAKAGKPQPIHVGDKIGRNDPCPCGSGKKYKQCHGK
ncbi:MAG: preprotein translocase subunit SecA [Bacteroidetes bacterium]|nr:preprotein translocase subunit SecA [Bacteroidota bacterium]MCW5894302.1 preprotein translocase subunit SecA [Bacteroidota bacterium]